jgi:hypothetical protein
MTAEFDAAVLGRQVDYRWIRRNVKLSQVVEVENPDEKANVNRFQFYKRNFRSSTFN